MNKNNQKNNSNSNNEKKFPFKSFFENSPLGNLIFDREGNLVHINKAAFKMLPFEDQKGLPTKINLFESFGISLSLKERLKEGEKYRTQINLKGVFPQEILDKHSKSIPEKYLDASITLYRYPKTSDYLFYVQLSDITQREKNREKLRKSEVMFRSIVENSYEGIFMVDDNYKFVYANDQLSKILKYPKEDIIGSDFRKVVDERYMKEVAQRYKKRQRGEDVPPRYVLEIVRKDGERRKVQLSSSVTTELRGGVKTIAQIYDITDKEEIQRKLNESIEIFNQISDQTFMTILILQDDEIKYSNKNFGSGLGYAPEEIKDWGYQELIKIIHPEDKDFVIQQAQKKQKGFQDTVNHYSFRVLKKDGSIAWREVYSKSIIYEGNWADLVMLIDITEKKQSEQQLIESEKKFRRIFEAIPDLFFLISKDLKILDYQGEGERLYIKPEEFLGKRITTFFSEKLNKKITIAIEETLTTRKPRIVEYKLDIKGKKRYFEARLLYYTRNQVAIFVREITSRKQVENMIKEEYKKLKELEQLRKDLISRVSHELKTPIMSISGASEILLESYQDNLKKDQIELLKIIVKNKERLENLIGNLLDVIRLENKRIEITKNEYNIENLIREILKEMQIFLKKRKINLELEFDDQMIVPVDKIRMEQVLINLLSNAIKNTPPNGKIRINTFHKANKCIIAVKDTGIGLTNDEKKKIFTKFGKIKRSGDDLEYLDIRGSGLGLYISKQIVLLHGGDIRVESPGRHKGSRFIVTIPMKEVSEIGNS